MSRKPVFLLYGIAAGVFWATVINHAASNTLVPATILVTVLASIFGLVGWHWAGSPELSSKQLLLLPVLPLVFLTSVLSVGMVILLLVAISPFLALQAQRQERQFRKLMKSKGRFIAINDLEARLVGGMGTLIVDCRPKGPRRVWWTADDLSSFGEPVSVEEEVRAIIEQKEHSFNSRCRTEYLDARVGKASLTSIPSRWAKSTKLADMFPKMKIVTVVQLAFPKEDPNTPEEVYRRFSLANLTGDELTIRGLILEHEGAEVLWQGPYPEDVAALLAEQYRTMEIVRVRPRDGKERTDTVYLQSSASPIPMAVVNIAGKWRVDASPIIEFRKAAQGM
jgi:hypothetical protein